MTATKTYEPSLFPTSMFPSLSPMTPPPSPPKEATHGKAEERDEVLETGTMLALLKIILG
jgi:hypothetical protein